MGHANDTRQPTALAPTRKVAAGGAGGAFAIVLVWLLRQFGVDMPAEVGSAVATLLAFAAAYATAERGRHAA